jgi:hypothetical protein
MKRAFRRLPVRAPRSGQVTEDASTKERSDDIDHLVHDTLYIKAVSGPVILKLANNALVVARIKASAADIKAGDYVASGGVPQRDGTQKAVELRIFPESMRGNGDGHRPGWPGAPNGTMTNGAVGQTVTSVDGPVLTGKFKDDAAASDCPAASGHATATPPIIFMKSRRRIAFTVLKDQAVRY